MSLQKIGRYEIKGELGRGGMAAVYLAYDPRFKRDVAVKVLPRAFMHDPNFRARFDREAQSIASLEHPAIVPVHDFGEDNDQPYLVMRHMSGGTLADRIRDKPLSVAYALSILGLITSALNEAHKAGIIHRDIKPSNILFDRRGDPFIGDFGIVKLVEATTHQTGSGMIGTPAYMAPELAQPGGLTPLVDIYALGVTLFEVLTGNHPYRADTAMGVMMAHSTQPIPDARQLRPDIPDKVQTIISRSLAKSPPGRYQSAAEMVDALTDPALSAPSMPPPAPPPTSPVPHNALTIDVDADGLPLPPTELLSQPVITPPSPTTTASTPFMQRWWHVAVGLLALTFPLPGALFSNPAPPPTGGGGPPRPPAPPPDGLSDNLALLAIASLLLLTIIGIEHFGKRRSIRGGLFIIAGLSWAPFAVHHILATNCHSACLYIGYAITIPLILWSAIDALRNEAV